MRLLAVLSGCALLSVDVQRAACGAGRAPRPSAPALQGLVAMHKRVIDVDASRLFARVLTVLLDAGYCARSANKGLGQIRL